MYITLVGEYDMFFENEKTNRLLRDLFSDPFGFERSWLETTEAMKNGSDSRDSNVRYYGLVVTTGPDGRPVVHEYGNARPAGCLQEQAAQCAPDGVRQPTADTIVDEKARLVKIITEMPGVEKRDIKIAVEGRYVEISAASGDKKYQVRAPLERKVDANSAKAAYHNGILQITFNLVEGNRNKKTIRVE